MIHPRTKLALNANWTKGAVGLSLTTTRYGKYTQRTAAGDDRYFGAKWITDVNASLTVTEFATLQAGATNVFNVRPERDPGGRPGRARRLRAGPLGQAPSRHRPELAPALGPGDPVLRVSRGRPPDHLHHQRDRGAEFQAAPRGPNPGTLPR